MARLIQILFGAGFTVALAVAVGSLWLGEVRTKLDRLEGLLLAFVAGAAWVSVAIFALCAAGLARTEVLLVGGLGVIGWGAWRWRRYPPGKSAPAAAIGWQVFFFSGLAIFLVMYCLNALAPEVSPDGAGYHLGNVVRIAERHGFAWDQESLYAWFPQGMEMLFLPAFCLGGHSAAALVHTAFLVALPLLLACFGRRCGLGRAGMGAGLSVFASPVVGIAGTSAYNDVALATASFAVLFACEVFVEINTNKLLFTIGLLAGFCAGIKYTGWLAVGLALWWVPKGQRRLWTALGAAVTAAPWAVRNWLWLGNPAAPFLNRWFPNPHYYPGPEQSYVADLRHYEAYRHWWQAAVDVAMSGGSITGMVGPVFLLAPLALLALRHPLGRRLLLGAAVWALPAAFNSGARFLIPALPFLALALGIALENSWGMLPAVAAFQLWACWPGTLAAYAAPWSWRIREVPVAAAFGRQPEAEFLAARLPDYAFKAAIEGTVAAGQKIFSYSGRAEAYLDRSIVVGYESAFGLLVQDILAQGVSGGTGVVTRWRLEGRPVESIRIRTRQPIAEVRVWNQGREVRPEGWRYTASANPWQAGLAFDGSAATRWLPWEAAARDFRVEAKFPAPLAVTEVRVEGGAGQVALEAPGASAGEALPVPQRDLRREAMRQLQARGIFYLLINEGDLPAQDFKDHSNLWGVTVIQEAHGTRFYRID